MVNSFLRLVSLFVLGGGEGILSNETRFHVKISVFCPPDNQDYDYRNHSKTNNQDTDLLTGFLLMKEEKKPLIPRTDDDKKARVLSVSVTSFSELKYSISILIQQK